MGEPQALVFVKLNQKCSKFPLASDFKAISGSVDSTTSLVDGFYVPAYGLKRVIEYHKGDRMSIWAIYEPIRAKIHNFLCFPEIASLAFYFFGYNLKSKGFRALKPCCVWHFVFWSGWWALFLFLSRDMALLKSRFGVPTERKLMIRDQDSILDHLYRLQPSKLLGIWMHTQISRATRVLVKNLD